MSILQLPKTIFQEPALAFGGGWLGSNGFGLCVGHVVYDKWGEDFLETADDVALADLGGDVCDESFLLQL